MGRRGAKNSLSLSLGPRIIKKFRPSRLMVRDDRCDRSRPRTYVYHVFEYYHIREAPGTVFPDGLMDESGFAL